MMFLLGKQAIFGHDPPMYLRSITATRCPCPANVHAAIVDPVPPPQVAQPRDREGRDQQVERDEERAAGGKVFIQRPDGSTLQMELM